jgi:hypothetical protein
LNPSPKSFNDSVAGTIQASAKAHTAGSARRPIPTPAQEDAAALRWQERVLDVPKDSLGALRLTNEIILTNPTGDCFKVKDLALAVQLPDGEWVETAYASDILCSVGGWLYSEGETFFSGRSQPVSLRLPGR